MKKVIISLLILILPALLIADEPDIDISLITIGPGKPVYVWWGHTALVITDNTRHKDYFVNFGLFNFDMDNFYFNFVMGRLYFMVGVSSYDAEIQRYSMQDRWIIRQHFNLTNDQKLMLYDMIRENTKKENRVYRYDHIFDNCVTRPRDMINTVLGNKLYESASVPSGLTLREHMRRFSQDKHFMQWWLMYGQGGVIDVEASEWDSMFLPVELYNNLKELPGVVDYEEIIVPVTVPDPDEPEHVLYYLYPFCVGLLLALVPFLSVLFPKNKHLLRARRIEGNVLLAIIGILGTTLIFLTVFTEHYVIHKNYNTLLNPFFALVPFFIPRKHRDSAKKLVWSVMLCIALLMCIFQPVMPHKNLNIVLTFLPLYAVYGGIPIAEKILKLRKDRSILPKA